MLLSSKFIKATDDLCSLGHPVAAPYFRREFCLEFAPQKAEITICGLGLYELSINGKDITRGFLAPYISNPDQICYYDNYDITDLLKEGKNVIGVTLGNGMRNCYGGFVWDFEVGRAPLALALALEAENGDNKFMLEADENFKVGSSPILYNDLRLGYTYDSNLETEGWDTVGFDDSTWENAKFCPTPAGEKSLFEAEPLAKTGEIKAVNITHYDRLPFAYENNLQGAKPIESTYRDDVYVYDFGINYSGVTKLKINGKKGQKITIRHGEYTQCGNFSINTTIFFSEKALSNYCEYAQKDEFICKGGEEEFVPKFKYDGFRYAFVEGLMPDQATEDAVTYITTTSDLKNHAYFNSSDATLNKLYEMITRSDISNFCFFPTDCPHREKNGWTGDAQASAERFMLTLNAGKSFKEWLKGIRKAQKEDGQLPGIIPTYTWGYAWGNGPMWDAVCTEIPYNVYRFDGDTDVISDNAQMMLRYVSYVMGRRDEKGLVAIGLGDWVDPFANSDFGGQYRCPLEVTDTIMSLRIAKQAQILFAAIGKTNESEFAGRAAGELRNAVREHLVDFDTYTVKGECQTAQATAIANGVFDDDEIEKAGKRLVEIIHKDNDINTCGFIGLRFMFHVLTRIGEADLAHKIITSKERSCYGYWVEQGFTTMLENFPFADGREICSLNHHFLGDIGSWMIQEVAGIMPNPELKGIDTFVIAPHFIDKLSFAEAKYGSKYGEITVKWEKDGDAVTLNISVPDGMNGEVKLSGYTCDVSALSGGKYEIKCKKA